MKTLLVTVALALVASTSSAAVQYEFVQKNTTADAVNPSSELTGRATVEGERSRIDFVGGTIYPPGTYVISTDGSRRLTFVDPTKEWFTEVNTATFATSIGASNIRVSNMKSTMETKDDRPIIAGLPSDHTRLTLTYDISVMVKTITLKQHVRTEIETWSTPQFAAAALGSFNSAIRTGNPEIDAILEMETTKVRGFPLRQSVTTRTVADLPPTRSELRIPATRTIVREMWVTSIREVPFDASMFVVPVTYRRADTPETPKTAAKVLTFESGSD
ncbi:MAG: hypothetical protein ABI779_08415 [Acidobacteriota bacterium]